MAYLAFLLIAPVIISALGTFSVIEVMGKAWHRPNLITRSLGGVGLLFTFSIGILWLLIALYYALWFAVQVFEGMFPIDMNGYRIH